MFSIELPEYEHAFVVVLFYSVIPGADTFFCANALEGLFKLLA